MINRNSSRQISLGGTYYIGATCKDGIAIGMDTRGVFLDGNNVNGYFDSVQKVFIVKGVVVCIAGLIAIGNKFISFIVDEFEKTLPDEVNPGHLLERFSDFFSKTYPNHLDQYRELKVTSYGYFDNKPMTCALDLGVCYNVPVVATGDPHSDFGEGKKYDSKFCMERSCDEVALVIEQAIINYALQNNKKEKVGGDIMLVKVTPNGDASWIKNEPQKRNWNTLNDFIEEYKRGNVPITFVSIDFEERFKQNPSIILRNDLDVR
jgi:20S proteasome alpha/beta subunit